MGQKLKQSYIYSILFTLFLSLMAPAFVGAVGNANYTFNLNGSIVNSTIDVVVPANEPNICRLTLGIPIWQPFTMQMSRMNAANAWGPFINPNNAIGYTDGMITSSHKYAVTKVQIPGLPDSNSCVDAAGNGPHVAVYIDENDNSKNAAFYAEIFLGSVESKINVAGLSEQGGLGIPTADDWPYIRGLATLENGKPFYSTKWKFNKIEADGNPGPTFYSTRGWPSVIVLGSANNPSIDGLENPASIEDAFNGKFRSDNNGKPLPDGTYKISLEESADDAMDEFRIAAKASLGAAAGAGLAVGATAACALIPPCAATGIAVSAMWAALAAGGAFAGPDFFKTLIKDNFTEGKPYFVGEGKVTIKGGKVSPDPVEITVSYVNLSPMAKALSAAIATLGSWVQTTLQWTAGLIVKLLDKTPDYVIGEIGCGKTDESDCGMIGPWTVMRNIGLTLLVMALIIIAFANVLQIDIEQYGMNRMIPKIIISIILAFTSWLIVTFFFDFTKAIQDQAVKLLDSNGSGGYGGLDFVQSISISTPSAGNILANSGSVLLLIVILVGVLVCGVILLWSLLLRVIMLCFLLAVAPLAFILNVVPFTSSLYKQWWTEFWKWMFMGPIALVIISLGAVIASSATGGDFGGTTTLDAALVRNDSGEKLLIGLIIFAAAMYMAATLPLKWGGSIMKSWGKVGKGIWGKTGGDAWKQTGGAFLKNRRATIDSRKSQWIEEQRAKIAGRGRLGQFAAGAGGNAVQREAMARSLKMNTLASKAKNYGLSEKSKPELDGIVANTKDEYLKEAAVMQLVSMGGLLENEPGKGGYNGQELFDKYAPTNGTLQGAAMKEQMELLLDSKDPGLFKSVKSKAKGGELKAMGGGQIESLSKHAGGVGPNTDSEKQTYAKEVMGAITPEQIKRAGSQAGGSKYYSKLATVTSGKGDTARSAGLAALTHDSLQALHENMQTSNMQNTDEFKAVQAEMQARGPVTPQGAPASNESADQRQARFQQEDKERNEERFRNSRPPGTT